MESFPKDKRVILCMALLALVSLIVLGSALKEVSFPPAQRLSQSDSETIQISVGGVINRIAEVPFWKQAVFWILLFFLVLMVSSLLSPELRKRILTGFLRIALFAILFLYLIENNPGFLAGLFSQGIPGADSSAPSLLENVPAPVFEAPQISGWLSYLITFVIILAAALIFWRVNLWWARRNEILNLGRPLGAIAEIARTSLQELSLGNVTAQDAIIQCYERMSRTVDTKRGLYRDSAMTSSEFVTRLESAGLPYEPVNRLTRLFESIRYGARTSEQRDVDEAISCLTSILEYCGETV